MSLSGNRAGGRFFVVSVSSDPRRYTTPASKSNQPASKLGTQRSRRAAFERVPVLYGYQNESAGVWGSAGRPEQSGCFGPCKPSLTAGPLGRKRDSRHRVERSIFSVIVFDGRPEHIQVAAGGLIAHTLAAAPFHILAARLALDIC